MQGAVIDPEVVYARRWFILAVLNLSLVIIVAGNSATLIFWVRS